MWLAWKRRKLPSPRSRHKYQVQYECVLLLFALTGTRGVRAVRAVMAWCLSDLSWRYGLTVEWE
jgi:hypothetical protein